LVVSCLAGELRAADKPLWVAVTTPALEPALKPLVEKRAADGFETAVSTKPIDKALAGLARKPDYLLLVGDYEKGKEQQAWFLATKWVKFYRWRQGQKSEFASDAMWGDSDGDGSPDVPVGRIPARTREEAALVVTKILAYEKAEPGPDDLRMPILTGATGYGPEIDTLASQVLLGKTKSEVPEWCEPRIICGDANSPYCGVPQEQPTLFNRELKQGCLLAAMIGHGQTGSFQATVVGQTAVQYTLNDAETGLAKGKPTGPAFVFACLAGDFTGAQCCLAEMMLGSPGGPVAVVAATTESHPLPNYYSSVSLMSSLDGGKRRIGDLWLDAQQRALEASDPMIEAMMADVEGKLEAQINVVELKREQALLYGILGDPATPLFVPEPLEATIEKTDSGWRWKATKPDGAKNLYVGVREAAPAIAPTGRGGGPQQARAAYEKANSASAFVPAGSPKPDAAWEGAVTKPCTVRLVATGPGVFRAAVLRAEASQAK
jgi:hypothetical protein